MKKVPCTKLIQDQFSITTIKTAYKKLALKNHPDKGGTIADWLAISDAYENITEKNHIPIVKSTDVQMISIFEFESTLLIISRKSLV